MSDKSKKHHVVRTKDGGFRTVMRSSPAKTNGSGARVFDRPERTVSACRETVRESHGAQDAKPAPETWDEVAERVLEERADLWKRLADL